MNQMMMWKACLEKKIVTQSIPDEQRAQSLKNIALTRLTFWEQEVEERFITFKIEAHYVIIQELLFALLYKNGYTCGNHLCLIAYLREHHPSLDYECEKIDELRRIRNEINYRGLTVTLDYWERNKLEFKNIIEQLMLALEN